MKVLYIATECKPFSKAGGIGDVTGELPPALKALGVDIEIVTPWYGSITKPEGFDFVEHGDKRVVTTELEGVPVNFIQSPEHFEGKYAAVYVNSPDIPFFDDALRFSFFSRACLRLIGEKQPDIVHINDWGLGYLFGFMHIEGITHKKVLTIHNIVYQGNLPTECIAGTEMEGLYTDPVAGPFFDDPRVEWQNVNPLRLGIELCDIAHAVSPNYAREITQPEDPGRFFEGGKGLEAFTQRLYQEGRLTGILNGCHYAVPATEKAFERTLQAKREMKKALSHEFKEDGFLLGFVGRAVEQKFRLLTEVLDGKSVLEHILDMPGVNVAVLAAGIPEYESFLKGFVGRPNYCAKIEFDPRMADHICLGSDVFLMPSLFEPCGIAQMLSMSNATPPLVRWTGGLQDTVTPHTESHGSGFGFDGANHREVLQNLLAAVHEAKNLYEQNPAAFRQLQYNAFRQRFPWEDSAKKYIRELYEPLMR